MKPSLRTLFPALALLVLSLLVPASAMQKMGRLASGSSTLVSGKVVMDDGSQVPPNIVIQRVCSGSVQTVTRTDLNGAFRFQWASASSPLTMPDATEAGGRQTPLPRDAGPLGNDSLGNRLMNCQLRANLAGYRSDSVDLSLDEGSDTIDTGSILLHRLKDGEGNSISATSLRAPKSAAKAYDSGLQSLAKNKPADAEKDFEKAVSIYPGYAEAWDTLGKLREQQKSYGPAREAFLKALEADPKLVVPYTELGFLAAEQRQWEESARYLDQALKLDATGYPEGWYADAVADYNLKLYDAAEARVREYLRLNPKNLNPRAHYLLAVTLIQNNNPTAGAAELSNYIALDPNAPDIPTLKQQLAEIQKQIGK